MNSNRRNFLLSGPAAMLAFEGFAELAEAQGGSARPSAAVADFWSNGMGVPAGKLLGGAELNSRGSNKNTGTGTTFAREPLFLYWDADDKVLMPASEIPTTKLSASGDSKVDFRLTRMRLNGDDDKVFQNYSSGGIYLDMSQQSSAPAAAASSSWITDLATPVFAALFPAKTSKTGTASPAGNTGTGSSGSGAAKKKGGLNFLPEQAAAPSGGGPAAPAATIPMQQPAQAQTIMLTGGMGKLAFSAFAKGRKKTAFGSFVDTILSLTTAASPFIPLLNLPVVGTASLTGIRTLVGNLQNHGGDQAPILQSPPIDLATAQAAMQQLDSALKLRSGQYMAIPQEHAAALKPQLANLKLLNGFLVPKEADEMDVFTVVPTTATQVSYLSLQVLVNPAGTASSKKG